MVDNDTVTYHLMKSLSEPANTPVRSLITQERTQKLELLIHLLANLTQPLIVCGPEGIGKTTLLKILQERKVESWSYCPIQGNADLSFEKIQEHMVKVIMQDKPGIQGQALATTFDQYESQKRKVILIIDNSGQLAPGLITTIIQYAASNPILRVVLVLTHDELHIKNRSDQAIDNCYIIEIPPLSEKQCGEFLQHLSTQSWTQISFNAINESMVETIYRETHGIPGKIIAELPVLANNSKSGSNAKWILPAAVVGLVAIALGVQWTTSIPPNKDNATAGSPVDQKQNTIEIAPSSAMPMMAASPKGAQNAQALQSSPGVQQKKVNEKISAQPETEDTLDDSAELEALAATEEMDIEQLPSHNMKSGNLADNAQRINDKPKKPEITKTIDSAEQVESEGPDIEKKKKVEDAAASKEKSAVMPAAQEKSTPSVTQTTNSYTLQLMVLSKQQSVTDLMKKYPSLGSGIRYSRKLINGKERYVLMYGSFSSAAQANQARNSLPAEFRKAIPIKMSAIK